MSVGAYQPARIVPNSEIVERIDSTDEWIRQRTGIESRRIAAADESVIDMAEIACNQALQRANLSMSDIDTIILAAFQHIVGQRAGHDGPRFVEEVTGRVQHDLVRGNGADRDME